jgi:type II secretory pathway pseudopilin PulG
MKQQRNRGVGLLQMLIALALIAVLMAILLPQLSNVASNKPGSLKSQTKDTANLYGIMQGLATMTGGGINEMPLPSELDRRHDTVPATQFAATGGVDPGKDTSANFFSVLLYQRVIVPQQLVANGEPNFDIVVDSDYQYGSPRAAENPGRAQWDPAFSADFYSNQGGNLSWAMQCRRNEDTFANPAAQPMFSHRGPEITQAPTYSGNDVIWDPADPASLTLDPQSGTWSGGIAYRDGHVEYESSIAPTSYLNDAGVSQPDVLFYDEFDDPADINVFLSIFVDAGPERDDYYAIWD